MLKSKYYNPETNVTTSCDKTTLYMEAKKIVESHLRGIDKLKTEYYDGVVRYEDLFRRAVAYGNPVVEGSKGIIFSYYLVWSESKNKYTLSLTFLKPNNGVNCVMIDPEKLQYLERGVFCIT